MLTTIVRYIAGVVSRKEELEQYRRSYDELSQNYFGLLGENARLEQDNANLQHEVARLRGVSHLPSPRRPSLSAEEAALHAREALRTSMHASLERRGW